MNESQRNVVVTGGSRGLGLAIAKLLVATGYRVMAIARSQTEELQAAITAAEKVFAEGGEQKPAERGQGLLQFKAFDLMNTAAIPALVESLRQEFGPIYGLVNNAGIGTGGILTLMRDEQIEALTRLNLLAPMLLSKYVLRSMMVQRAGRIVNISSIASGTGLKGLAAYSATKAALLGFTRSLAREVGELGITVNAVAPGFLETDMTDELTPEQRERIMRRSALRRLAEVGDVAAAVEFLLSEKARNITGTTLTVDAGATA
jgi:3-oxoacyl-[acyl-carrier protein] reductase